MRSCGSANRRHLLPAMLAICTRACRSAHRRHLSPAMLATEQPRRWTNLKGARWTPPRSRQAGRAESDSSTSAASGTDQGNGDDPPAVLSGREAHELSSWGWLPPTVMGRTRGQSQRLQDESAQSQRVIEDAMSAAVQKWSLGVY